MTNKKEITPADLEKQRAESFLVCLRERIAAEDTRVAAERVKWEADVLAVFEADPDAWRKKHRYQQSPYFEGRARRQTVDDILEALEVKRNRAWRETLAMLEREEQIVIHRAIGYKDEVSLVSDNQRSAAAATRRAKALAVEFDAAENGKPGQYEHGGAKLHASLYYGDEEHMRGFDPTRFDLELTIYLRGVPDNSVVQLATALADLARQQLENDNGKR